MTSTTVPQEAVKAMPERIYAAKKTEGSNCVVSFDTPSLDYNVEYVRADLALPHLPQGEPSAARELALEEAAQVAEQFRNKDWIAHDMRTGVFPKQSEPGIAIAAAIRSLAHADAGKVEGDGSAAANCQPVG